MLTKLKQKVRQMLAWRPSKANSSLLPSTSKLLLQRSGRKATEAPTSLQDAVRLGAIARQAIKGDFWKLWQDEVDRLRLGVLEGLIRGSDKRDDEARAMLFALDKALEFPQRLIENGDRAARALQAAADHKRLENLESLGQATELLGHDQMATQLEEEVRKVWQSREPLH